MQRHTPQSGFTLLEMFCPPSLFFIVVMLIAVGSLLSIIDASRKAQAQKEVLNNLNFAIEGLARTARVGSTYHCVSASGADQYPIHEPEDCPTTAGVGFCLRTQRWRPQRC